eukprot:TRINITY_DN1825_c0_g1_i6.p1 TRINITY_DN1825_c0_g1~~TRINITY_DN1825_c0_g1_i6.p1  ORF type:complete len:236 (-),score=18.73 TRINITY_DN1825_c0_g1_i6:250-957(-)
MTSHSKPTHQQDITSYSPAEKAGLIPYFDFIIEVNGVGATKENRILENTLVTENLEQVQKWRIFNVRTETKRDVELVPSNSWGGTGFAGISVRYQNIDEATEYVWHVLEVYQKSPALDAGLVSFEDYIVGSPDIVFTSYEHFFHYVRTHMGVSLFLYVFSRKTNQVRLVSLTANEDWGGEGCLGCNIGTGYVHRIPALEISQVSKLSYPTTSPSPHIFITNLRQKTLPLSWVWWR